MLITESWIYQGVAEVAGAVSRKEWGGKHDLDFSLACKKIRRAGKPRPDPGVWIPQIFICA